MNAAVTLLCAIWITPLLIRKSLANSRQRYERAVSKSFFPRQPGGRRLLVTASTHTINPWGFSFMWATPMASAIYFMLEAQRREAAGTQHDEDDHRDQKEDNEHDQEKEKAKSTK